MAMLSGRGRRGSGLPPLEAGRYLRRDSVFGTGLLLARTFPVWNCPHPSRTPRSFTAGKTAISRETFQHIADAFGKAPEGFTIHKKLKKLMDQRVEMGRTGNVNWGMGELLAFGSLLMEGTDVRMSGQDVQRGTFVQRHVVLYDHITDEEWSPLEHLSEDQGKFRIYHSFL